MRGIHYHGQETMDSLPAAAVDAMARTETANRDP